MKETMTPGERFLKAISFESVDRIPMMDFGYWRETIDNWHKQGLPDYVNSTEEVEAYFGLDRGFETNLINYWGDNGPVGIMWGIWPEWTKVKVQETDEVIVYEGEIGRIVESKTSGSIPAHERSPIETMADFERLVVPRMNAWDPTRVTPALEGMIARGKEQGQAIGTWIDGFYAWPRILMGPTNLLYAFYDDPDLLHAIQREHTKYIKQWIDMVLTHTKIDYVYFFEDMAYNNGSFISDETFDEFMMPYYHEVVGYMRSKGIQKMLVDSDGNTVKLTDKFVEAGMDCHSPLEINSGSQPAVIRKRHPKLALIGGVDKLTLAGTRADIDLELAKLPPILEKGGYIPALDHRVQPDVPMANYQYYIDQKRKILEKYCY
jgi:uroporphyrinogen decarboxylase